MANPGGGDALFEREGDRYLPTELSIGPWDPEALHGGPVTGLLAHVLESHDHDEAEPFELVRLSAELTRPTPRRALSVEATTTHPGRRIRRVMAVLRCDGVEVAHATGLRVRSGERAPDVPSNAVALEGVGGGVVGDLAAPAFPDQVTDPATVLRVGWVAFHSDALEYRLVEGDPWAAGPATAWLRLRVPLLCGVPMTARTTMAAVSDMGSGLSWDLSPDGRPTINTDVIVHYVRVPTSDWLCLSARSVIGPGGIGWAETHLFDRAGLTARVDQTLVAAAQPWQP